MKLGDYVEILSGVHDDAMPDNRRDGLVIELLNHDKGCFGTDYDQVMVMFHNGKILSFTSLRSKYTTSLIEQKALKFYNKIDKLH